MGMLDGTYRRAAMTNQLWMTQRILDYVASCDADARAAIRSFLASIGGEDLLEMQIPRLARHGMTAALVA